jgi:hypothetical protein
MENVSKHLLSCVYIHDAHAKDESDDDGIEKKNGDEKNYKLTIGISY